MSEAPQRTVLLHYHLFKNAGTSLDQVLKRNFGERWVTREFEGRAHLQSHGAEVAEWIASHPEAVAFSSHTAELPPPRIDGVTVIPLIFVRHPLDRIASAYAFERKQGSAGFGSVLARNTSLQGYCEVRLSLERDRQCRNFQCARFARMFPAADGSELERSLRAVDALPFVGVVEDFEGSMRRLQALLAPDFPDFRAAAVAANVSRDVTQSLDEKLAALREEMGAEAFDEILACNADDLRLHEAAVARSEARA